MKSTLDFQVIDKTFKENHFHRLSYFTILDTNVDDLIFEFKKLIKIYIDKYANLCDLIEILYNILCHIIHEFKDSFQNLKAFFDDICQLFGTSVTIDCLNISFDDIINEKCLYYKTVMNISKDKHSVFVNILREARCVYLGLFLKRILTLRVCDLHNDTSSSNYDMMIIRDLEESVASLSGQDVHVMQREDDNYSVVVVKGALGVSCANISGDDWSQVALGLEDGTVLIGDTEGRSRSLVGHSMSVMDLAFSRDSKRLLTCSLDTTVRLWDPESGRCLDSYRNHNLPVWCVSCSPTAANCFVSGGMDGSVCLWDVNRALPLRKLVGHLSSVKVTAFHGCGRYVASGGDDGHVRLWDVRCSNSGGCVRLWESKAPSKTVCCLDLEEEANCVTWASESGLVESAGLGDGCVTRGFNIAETVSSLVCRRGSVVVLATVNSDIYIVDSGGQQISKMVTEECGRILAVRGTKEVAGHVVFIREHRDL